MGSHPGRFSNKCFYAAYHMLTICKPFQALYSWENNKTETNEGQIQTDPEKNSTKISVIAGISTLR